MMREQVDRPLSRERRRTALSIAAMAGTTMYLAIEYARVAIGGTWQQGIFDGLPPEPWAFYIAFGSFVAMPVCLIIGMPLWYFAERAGWRSRRKAIQLGTLAGAIVGIGFLILATPGSVGFSQFAGFFAAGAVGGLVTHGVAFGRIGGLPRPDRARATSDTDDRGTTA